MRSVDLILSLTGDEFKKFFADKLLPKLIPLEEKRLASIEKNKRRNLIIISVSVILFFIIFQIGGVAAMQFLSFVAFGIFALTTFFNAQAELRVKDDLDREIMPTLFSYWGDFYFCKNPLYGEYDFIDLINELAIFSGSERALIDDCIIGKYNGLDIKVTEAYSFYEVESVRSTRYGSRRETRRVDTFRGLMFEVDMNKNFNSHTVVKTDFGAFQDKQLNKELRNVRLEDLEFEKEFEVYSDNQVEARYILTPSFMERLVKYKRGTKQRVEVVFYNQKAYFFLTFYQDKFEVPVNKPITDFSYYRNILSEFAQVLSLVDALKLEQNIGL